MTFLSVSGEPGDGALAEREGLSCESSRGVAYVLGSRMAHVKGQEVENSSSGWLVCGPKEERE